MGTSHGVRDIGLAVREALQNDKELADSAYHKDNLRNACSIASKAMVRILRRNGHNAEFVTGVFDRMNKRRRTLWGTMSDPDHCWVTVDGQIVDITATQFEVKSEVYMPKVVKKFQYQVYKTGGEAIRYVNEEWIRSAGPLDISRIVRRAEKILKSKKEKLSA